MRSQSLSFSLAASTSAELKSPLAPATMRIELSPDFSSTRIVAVPVDWFGMRRTWRVSIP